MQRLHNLAARIRRRIPDRPGPWLRRKAIDEVRLAREQGGWTLATMVFVSFPLCPLTNYVVTPALVAAGYLPMQAIAHGFFWAHVYSWGVLPAYYWWRRAGRERFRSIIFWASSP